MSRLRLRRALSGTPALLRLAGAVTSTMLVTCAVSNSGPTYATEPAGAVSDASCPNGSGEDPVGPGDAGAGVGAGGQDGVSQQTGTGVGSSGVRTHKSRATHGKGHKHRKGRKHRRGPKHGTGSQREKPGADAPGPGLAHRDLRGAWGAPTLAADANDGPSGQRAFMPLASSVDAPGRAMTKCDMIPLGWTGMEAPRVDSITTLAAVAGDTTPSPAGPIMRVELRPGDMYSDPGYSAPRAEVYGRTPQWFSDPGSMWPDPPGSVRWFDFYVMIPDDFPVATDARWLVFTQWKGLRGGSPPIALEVKRSGLRLGGARTNSLLIPQDGYLGPIAFGDWTRLTVGMELSDDPSVGWVQVFRDGREVIPVTHVATLDTVNSSPDPIYLKQGIYRDDTWNVTQNMYFSPMKVSSQRPDLG